MPTITQKRCVSKYTKPQLLRMARSKGIGVKQMVLSKRGSRVRMLTKKEICSKLASKGALPVKKSKNRSVKNYKGFTKLFKTPPRRKKSVHFNLSKNTTKYYKKKLRSRRRSRRSLRRRR